MIGQGINRRLAQLERAGSGAGWEAGRHVPMEQWPDTELWGFLGLPPDAPDAELEQISEAAPPGKSAA